MQPNHHQVEEERIRDTRLRSNVAIARKEVDAIAAFWTDEIHVVSSTGVGLSGIEANRRFYTRQFASRPDTSYVRTPAAVQVMDAWGVALESGGWVATWTDADGPVEVTGFYMAQWLRAGKDWRIHAELYTPTSCVGGAYCSRHPSGN